jgi:hypothetical protein
MDVSAGWRIYVLCIHSLRFIDWKLNLKRSDGWWWWWWLGDVLEGGGGSLIEKLKMMNSVNIKKVDELRIGSKFTRF